MINTNPLLRASRKNIHVVANKCGGIDQPVSVAADRTATACFQQPDIANIKIVIEN